MAAVYSVNAVGYVNTVCKPGFTMVSNPLLAASDKVSDLFKGVPDGTTLYSFANNNFDVNSYSELLGGWDNGDATVKNGGGVFVLNPNNTAFTVTFVGEVPQGNLTTAIDAGFQIVSSKVPQAGTLSALGYTAADGDTVYQWSNSANNFVISSYVEITGGWDPSEPTVAVGESFFLLSADGHDWTRSFSVNN